MRALCGVWGGDWSTAASDHALTCPSPVCPRSDHIHPNHPTPINRPINSINQPTHDPPTPLRYTRELDQAVKFLSQAIQLEPENEKNHYRRYRAHLRGKKYREALSDLSQSITLDPENGQKVAQRAK